MKLSCLEMLNRGELKQQLIHEKHCFFAADKNDVKAESKKNIKIIKSLLKK